MWCPEWGMRHRASRSEWQGVCHNVGAMSETVPPFPDDPPAPHLSPSAGAPPVESPPAPSPLTGRLLDLLATHDVAHRALSHPPARTSEEASRLRGTPLGAGAKALVCHADDRIVLIVVPADARLDTRAFKAQTGVKNVRMVDAAEIEALVGAPVGAVPPFGSLFGLTTYADREVVGRNEIAFNAGARDFSVVISGPDFERLERPIQGDFARRADA